MDQSSLLIFKIVQTTGSFLPSAVTFNGNNKEACGNALALSPKYYLYKLSAGCSAIS